MAKPHRFVCAILAMLLVPARGFAQDHVVSVADVQARLAAAAFERAAGLRAVESALATPAAAQAAALTHTDLDRIRRGVSSLTDAELRDVAARAQRLTVDPVAGTNPVLLVLAVLGAAVVLLFAFILIVCAAGHCGD
jgi:hypothetical protein